MLVLRTFPGRIDLHTVTLRQCYSDRSNCGCHYTLTYTVAIVNSTRLFHDAHADIDAPGVGGTNVVKTIAELFGSIIALGGVPVRRSASAGTLISVSETVTVVW